jgi:hypothetical protein
MNTRDFLAAGVIGLVLSTAAMAQSGAELMVRPWVGDAQLQTRFDARIFGEAGGSGLTDDLELQWYEGAVRARSTTERGSLAAGVSVSHLELGSNGQLNLPERLMDYSVGVGVGVAKWGEWEVALQGGIGMAGDEWNDSDALYGIGNIILTNKIDDNRTWQVFLNYNGNRPFLPDVPLPGVAFHHKLSDTLRYSAGFPYSSIVWEFLPQWTIDASFLIPYNVNATLSFRPVETWRLFASIDSEVSRYRWDFADDVLNDPNTHLLFRQRRLEAGVAWEPCDWAHFVLAGGYAFDQEFEAGWDGRDADEVLELDEAPYIRAGFNLSF